MNSCVLPLHWEPELLKADLQQVESADWTPHYNAREGSGWSGLALRSASGSASQIDGHEASAENFVDTELLSRTPHFQHVLEALRCRLKSVRLLKLASRSAVREHSDPSLARSSGEVRIHIPVRTNPDVEFYLDGDRLLLTEGKAYFLDVSCPHRIKNTGSTDRVHLVIDAELNEWLRNLLHQGEPVPRLDAPARSFSKFREAILESPVLQQRLCGTQTRDGLASLLVKTGEDRGFEFGCDDLERTSTPTLAPPRRQALKGWVPIGVKFQEEIPFVEMNYIGTRRMSEPFYEDTITAARRDPFSQAFRWKTRLEGFASNRPPTGFIFHMSRCGSTLLSRMLSSIPRATAISEAPPLDDVLQAPLHIKGITAERHQNWLRAIVSALTLPFAESEMVFIKLDAWHIHELPLIRTAFPDVPWIFLYRDPVEVLVSQARHPGRFALPGGMAPSILGLAFADVVGLTREEWCARVLADFCRSALRFADDRGCFINYRHLPQSLWNRVASHFAISFTPADVEIMQSVAALDAKSPGQQFHPDSDRKRLEATPSIRELAGRELHSLYCELEAHPKTLR